MSLSSTTTPRLIRLVDDLLADIEARNLQPGDRYHTTSDASKLLGVSNGLANRALQLLERRQIIKRQQRRGAYIANLSGVSSTPCLRRVHFLVHQNYLASEGIGNDMVLIGMQDDLPGVHVQISFLPKENADAFVADLVNQSFTNKAMDGFILVRAPYEVHHLLSNSGMPALVYGGVYPGITRLSRIDRDMSAVGYIAADYLLKRGHKRIAFLSRQQALPGDHDTMDAIRRRLSEEGMIADSMTERFLPPASNVCEAEVSRLLRSEPRATGFICRTLRMADAAKAVSQKSGLKLGRDVDIVLCDYYLNNTQSPQYVFPRPVYSAEEQGKHMARMLAAMSRGEVVKDEVIPIVLDSTAESATEV